MSTDQIEWVIIPTGRDAGATTAACDHRNRIGYGLNGQPSVYDGMVNALYGAQTSVRAARESTPIYDALILEPLAAPRPSLWTRTEILIGFAALVLFVALLASPWLAS